jgi:hypothetical protein
MLNQKLGVLTGAIRVRAARKEFGRVGDEGVEDRHALRRLA